MPFWGLNDSPKAYHQAFQFFIFPRFQSKFASWANFHGPTHTESAAASHVWHMVHVPFSLQITSVLSVLSVSLDANGNLACSEYFNRGCKISTMTIIGGQQQALSTYFIWLTLVCPWNNIEDPKGTLIIQNQHARHT